jgi:protein dithiol oxidoreductase (disulfide-forming)
VSLSRQFLPILFLVFAGFVSAEPQLGRDYLKLDARVASPGNRIELIEFFSYSCLGCYQLGPDVDRWYLSQLDDVDLILVPLITNEQSARLARLFYALEALDRLTNMHYEVFRAIHDQENRLWEMHAQLKWVSSYGVNVDEFKKLLNSDQVDERVNKARALAKQYPISVTPTLLIDRTFWTTASMIRSQDRLVPILNFLITESIERRKLLTGMP